MASTCAGSLALLDAGVPISNPVAGVAMGILLKNYSDEEITAKKEMNYTEDYVILTDLFGISLDLYGNYLNVRD